MTPSLSRKATFFIEQLLLHDFGKEVTERRTEILVLSSILPRQCVPADENG
jgi:hypothetical protein